MEDERIWPLEESLWTADPQHYRELIDDECLMVLPEPPFVLGGEQAVAAVSDTPRWSKVEFSAQQVRRPQEGLIVIAYKARAEREGHEPYEAHCTTTFRRLGPEEWRVIQHQQTPPLVIGPSERRD
ncbi:nuclear transport factor 2 family protein [Teichococcus vastitatis]|jgi:hypothetical protein|uniref:DUF4440 domain-containing protein n=1 Tax=Teichococcus vastitatis TaxID=2307076 RepID=A0ABS9W1C6_9PROT|nr:nuclear transport factor 2 family protein [Pseudoroseomonas vastitatis]MCI0753097.1 DUF4440 domain-containing protein [Pseudoroseomonas vastitatis]